MKTRSAVVVPSLLMLVPLGLFTTSALAQDTGDMATVYEPGLDDLRFRRARDVNEPADGTTPDGGAPGAPGADGTGAPTGAAPGGETFAVEPSRWSASVGFDITSQYFFRGIRQEEDGFIFQPYGSVGLDVLRLDNDVTLNLSGGVWNSIHSDTDTAASEDSIENWYELDAYVGGTLALGNWSVGAFYTWFTSPSDAFATYEEVSIPIAYDDTGEGDGLLWGLPLRPAILFAIETGTAAADGGETGTYLELAVEPGIPFDDGLLAGWELTFPVSVGFSLDDYYEGSTGDDDGFGYASIGATLAVPLPLDQSWGEWTFRVGVQGLFLGDNASDINEGDEAEAIVFGGLGVAF